MINQQTKRIVIIAMFIITILTPSLLAEISAAQNQTPYARANIILNYATVSQTSADLDLIIDSPQARYYTSSNIPIDLTGSSTTWNVYNGTHWLFSSPKPYTSPTMITLDNGEYRLHAWNGGVERSVVFGVNTRNIGAVYAIGGSNTEIQAAVNSANVGYAVYLPAGTYEFDSVAPWNEVSVPAGISIYGAPVLRDANGQVTDWNWNTILTMPYDAANYSFFFKYTGTSSYLTRFTGIKIVGYREFDSSHIEATYEALRMVDGNSEFRVDHCHFRNVPGTATVTSEGARGVMDHCVLINYPVYLPGVWNSDSAHYGFVIAGPGEWLTRSSVVGKYNSYDWYVEDNYFSGYEVCMQTSNAGHYVFRYNTVENGALGASLHSNVASGYGGRCAEVYGNTFTYVAMGDEADMAGVRQNCGTLIVTGNTFIDFGINNGLWDSAIHLIQGNPDSFSWSQIQDTYIWGNVLNPQTARLIVKRWDNGATSPITEGTHYYLRPPSFSADGWEYKPYLYPHPLVDD
jgi:hypothetical protein